MQTLSIEYENVDKDMIVELFNGHQFPNLSKLTISNSEISKLEKKIFDGFPALETLIIERNYYLQLVDFDAFSDLTSLRSLKMSENGIEKLDAKCFKGLENLQELDLSNNHLRYFDVLIIDSMETNIKRIDLSENWIENKEEIVNGFKNSKIEIIF